MSFPDFLYKHATMRNLVVLWGCTMITIAVLRFTRIEAVESMTTASATVATGIFGILGLVLKFHQKRKVKD